MNPLISFSGNLSGLLSSLSFIDATGITGWTPEKELFQLRMFKQINGLSFSAQCRNCKLYQDTSYNVTRVFRNHLIRQELCYKNHDYIRKDFVSLAHLLNNSRVQLSCSSECVKYFYETRKEHVCWPNVLRVLNTQTFFGGMAVILNFIVFSNIITSKQLRKNVSMSLVCNMALSDCLMGVYCVAIGIFLNSDAFPDEAQVNNPRERSRRMCWKIGFLWMFGQTGSVVTSFLLTLEIYLVIVYSLRPEVRLTRRVSFLCLIISWCLALCFAIYAFYFRFYQLNLFCVPISLHLGINPFVFAIAVSILALICYSTSIVFYIHIYVVAKRAAQNAGVRRESKLAKKIALVVLTNIAFFILPVAFTGIVFLTFDFSSFFVYFVTVLFPGLCLSINSCCNPLLHAFRHDKFKVVFKPRIVSILQTLRKPFIDGISRLIATRGIFHFEEKQ